MDRILTLAFSIAAIAVAVAAPHQAMDADAIKDKIRISLGQALNVQFTANGDRLQQPRGVEQAGNNRSTVKLKLDTTEATPVPVRGVAKRPFLVVSNGFERALTFRALARLRGSTEFFPIRTGSDPIAPGDQATKCWESGSLVEEVVLYGFALIPKSSK